MNKDIGRVTRLKVQDKEDLRPEVSQEVRVEEDKVNRLRVRDRVKINKGVDRVKHQEVPGVKMNKDIGRVTRLKVQDKEDLRPEVSQEVRVEEDKVNRLRVRDRVKISKRVDRVKHQEVPGPAKTISRTQDQARM